MAIGAILVQCCGEGDQRIYHKLTLDTFVPWPQQIAAIGHQSRAEEAASIMVGRIWRAWATTDNADAYEHLLRSKILPEIDAAEGCQGAYVLRREHRDEVEFVVLHFFDSIDAVREFAGDNYEAAVVPEPARNLLVRFDATAQHYDVRAEPTPASS